MSHNHNQTASKQPAPSTKEPEFIRLMDAFRTTVLDSVATEYEDSFCLESFGDLVKSATEAEGGSFLSSGVATS